MTPLHEIADVALKLCVAAALSGLLGIERERKGRAAGLRTHILVCVGSALSMIVTEYLAVEWAPIGANVRVDASRIAAGIVTGIGFIGAGTIINVGSVHRGLTTAAMLWFVAIVGIAVGSGYYLAATMATLIAFLTATALSRVMEKFPSEAEFSLDILMPGGLGAINQMEGFIKRQGYRVTASRLRVIEKGSSVDMTFDIISHPGANVETLVQLLHDNFADVQRITLER